MYITIHEPNGVIQLESEESFKDYTKDKVIIEAAGGLVFNEKNELLMIFRRGFWDLPKGKVDEGETLEQCAVREVQEETGLQNIMLGDFLIFLNWQFFSSTKTFWLVLLYAGAMFT